MPAAKKTSAKKAAVPMTAAKALAALKAEGNAKYRADMEPRYGIVAPKAWGVPMNRIQAIGKSIGTDHALAQSLWASGWYEARILAGFIADPALLTPAAMDRWAKDFDNWAIVDSTCFKLFDRSPHAYARAEAWCAKKPEFVKRAGFALYASLALHDKAALDGPFITALALSDAAAMDERNFVKKGVSWAMRAIGRRNPKLRAATLKLAEKLAASPDPTSRWLGKDVLRDLSKAKK